MFKGKSLKTISILIVVCLCLCVLISCNAVDKAINITAKSMFDGNYLSIEVKGSDVLPGSMETTGYITFKSEYSIDDIFSSLGDQPNLVKEKYNDAILFKLHGNEQLSLYCLSKAGARYVFGGMCGNVIVDIAESSERIYKKILLPVHLISDELILNGERPYYTLYANVDYLVDGTKDEILSFYQECGWYDVEHIDNLIIINGWKHDPDTMIDALNYEGLDKDVPFAVRLTEKDGNLYFAIVGY